MIYLEGMMQKKNTIKKVLDKLAGLGRPTLGTFYILGGVIYYSTMGAGKEHKELWKIIVNRVFKDLPSSDKAALLKANYGADRGRVTWKGDDFIEDTPIGEGHYLIEGSPG